MRVPILTYHSINIRGNEYGTNDHVAFADDLRTLTRLGLQVVPLPALVAALRTGAFSAAWGGCVGISFDDGQDFDYVDLTHPSWGPQRSLFNIMRDFQRERGVTAQPQLHATSFVIVSPEARRALDVTCMEGQGWWNDHWWPIAVASGLLTIGNHSWDHNHATLARVAQREQLKGTFRNIDTFEDAEAQIAQAASFLRTKADNPGAALFAYPYGESNEYLLHEYFPRNETRIGVDAAFGCGNEPVTAASNLWDLPRYVSGDAWRSPEDFVRLLRDSLGPGLFAQAKRSRGTELAS